MTATLDHNMIDHDTHTMSAYRLSCFVRGWQNVITVTACNAISDATGTPPSAFARQSRDSAKAP